MFQVKHSCDNARVGILNTVHGKLKTPFFMPVATNASVKTLAPHEISSDVIISNSFILSLKPGLKVIESFGGLHKYMNWDKGIFTDSGGFQILDDYFRQKLSDRGVVFKNPFTGKDSLFTPEDSMELQIKIGSDVAMALDDVPKFDKDKEYVKASIKRTYKWANRCLRTHDEIKKNISSKQLLFGICQGGLFSDFRKRSGKEISAFDFDGLAIGGLCIGETKEQMFSAIDAQMETIDKTRPIYLMGVGSPEDIVDSVYKGVDIFDSIYPTRNARRGSIFTPKGQIQIKNMKYRDDKGPIYDDCTCFTCKNFSKAFVSHQLSQKEYLGYRLATIHNLHFISDLIKKVRVAITKGEFESFRKQFHDNYVKPKRNSSSFWQSPKNLNPK